MGTRADRSPSRCPQHRHSPPQRKRHFREPPLTDNVMICSEGIRACLEHEAHNFAAEQLPRMASADAEEGGGAPRDRWGGFGCGHGDFEFCVCCLRM